MSSHEKSWVETLARPNNLYFPVPSMADVIDRTAPVPLQKYQAAIDLVISRWGSLPQPPVAIYGYGNIGTPGISDLDFLVVFQPGKKVGDPKAFLSQAFPPWVQELMIHKPLICTTDSWPTLHHWVPHGVPKRLWGAELAPPEVISTEFKPGCNLGIAIDNLITRLPRSFLESWWQRPMNLRKPLMLLNHLKIQCNLLSKLGIAIPSAMAGFLHDFDALRSSWFATDAPTRLQALADLTERGCDICGHIIGEFDRLLAADQKPDRRVAERLCIGKPGLMRFQFIQPWTLEQALRESYENHQQTGRVQWPSPMSFAGVLSVYADSCSKLRGCLEPDDSESLAVWNEGRWGAGLRHRARCVSRYLFELTELGMADYRWVGLGLKLPTPLYKEFYWLTDHLFRARLGPREYLQRMSALVRPRSA